MLPYYRRDRVAGVQYLSLGVPVTWTGRACVCAHGKLQKNCNACRGCRCGRLLRECPTCLQRCTCPRACKLHGLCKCGKCLRSCSLCSERKRKPKRKPKRKRKPKKPKRKPN